MDTRMAFETLLGELREAFEDTQRSMEDAMKRSDFSAIRQAADRGETIQERIDRLESLRQEWGDIVRAESAKTARRAPRGATTPQKAYRVLILRALEEMGGQGRTAHVVDRVGELMEHQFTEADLQPLPSGKEIRWQNKVRWARNAMVENGLLGSDSPRGIWEMTQKGRDFLRNHQSA